MTRDGRGKAWAYGAAIVGGAFSVAANVAHSFVPVQTAGLSDEAWQLAPYAHPRAGAVVLAAFWPMALLLALEVVARVDWPNERRWVVVRWGGLTPVALVAAIVSYQHLAGLARWYGEGASPIVPLGIDGLMVVCSGALIALAPGRSGRGGAGLVGSPEASEPLGASEHDEADSTEPDERVPLPEASERVAERVQESFEASEPDERERIVVEIGSHRHPPVRRASETTARQGDVDSIRGALTRGELQHPLKTSLVMKTLHIGAKAARAAIAQIEDERARA